MPPLFANTHFPDEGAPESDELSHIDQTYSENTGGGCMVDVLVLKSGKVISISDDSVAVWPSLSHWQNSDTGGNGKNWMEL